MLERLKQMNLDRLLDMDEAVSLSAYARGLQAEYEELGLPAPQWLETSVSTLRTEIARRTHASDLAEMRRIEGELESYKTVTEKRGEAQRKLGELQKKLGMVPARAAR